MLCLAVLSRLVVAVGLLGASSTLYAVQGAPQPSDPRLDYRRPVAAADAGRPEDDAVWRLGRQLFFDPGLSASGQTACTTCHRVDYSWTIPSAKAVGDNGKTLAFRAPTLLNVGLLDRLGWTGKFADTGAVSMFAMSSAANMNLPMTDLLTRLGTKPTYVAAFQDAFSHQTIGSADVGAALTRYVNSITSATAPFDRWIAGDPNAIGADAKRGFVVFNGKGRCAECHRGWAFTDGSFHDIGSAATDPGRGAIFKTSIKLQHAFKTPTLRNVAERPPYMHDGSKQSLDDVVDLYDRGGIERPSRAEAIAPLHLAAAEKADLVAFLKTLTSGTDFVARP
jgi:cytochrome c peroxidase